MNPAYKLLQIDAAYNDIYVYVLFLVEKIQKLLLLFILY